MIVLSCHVELYSVRVRTVYYICKLAGVLAYYEDNYGPISLRDWSDPLQHWTWCHNADGLLHVMPHLCDVEWYVLVFSGYYFVIISCCKHFIISVHQLSLLAKRFLTSCNFCGSSIDICLNFSLRPVTAWLWETNLRSSCFSLCWWLLVVTQR